LQDQRGNTTTWTYDELYRATGMRDPLGRASVIESYDANDNVKVSVDRLGRKVFTDYDELDRTKKVTYADAVVDYQYDAAGRTTRIDDSQSGFAQWSYDNGNRVLSETTNNGVVSYGYNDANQRTAMTALNRPAVNYGYDTVGRLSTITQGAETFTYGYDTLSRRSSLQRPNGVTTNYTYDEVNRLKRLTHANSVGNIEDLQYSYNLNDEISAITSLNSATNLPTAKTATAANAANRISQVGAVNYSFDNHGQTTSKTDTTGTTNYNWDARGRLTKATLPNGNSVDYGFDALGRRANRTANNQITNFVYDGQDVVADKVGANVTTDYLNGTGIDDKLRQNTASTGSLYFLQDHLGSTNALTSAGGGVVERQTYEAFGATNGSSLTRYGYTGRERDDATGLMYYRARWYDSGQGRFITEDPIGFDAGTNFYGYVNNNSIGLRDPLGLDPYKLPADPYGVPKSWIPDTHGNPDSIRWNLPDGKEKIEFEIGTPGGRNGRPGGYTEKDHWHKWVLGPKGWEKEKGHYEPGEECELNPGNAALSPAEALARQRLAADYSNQAGQDYAMADSYRSTEKAYAAITVGLTGIAIVVGGGVPAIGAALRGGGALLRGGGGRLIPVLGF
jgi:RHS repeat-associated protein